jgi:thiamine biosynthesis lipoprotein
MRKTQGHKTAPGTRFFPLVLAGLTAALFPACFPQKAEQSGASAEAGRPLARTEFVLGTVCSITVYEAVTNDVFRRAFDRVREIDRRMSVTLPDSDISRVNAAAGLSPVPAAAETIALVESGLEFSRLSGGAFNIALGPLVALWGIGTDHAAVPAEADIRAALGRIDFNLVVPDKSAGTLFLRAPGMGLDLGAIAKGYAADEAADILRKAGVSRAVIDFGGNILTLGTRPNGMKWRVGVQDPGEIRGKYLGILEVSGKAVVSSGVYERFFLGADGRRYHHILDTKTGYPARNGLVGVTVTAENSRDADALSTSFFALGLRDGLALAEKTKGVEALFVTEDKKLYATPGLRDSFRVTDGTYKFGRDFYR